MSAVLVTKLADHYYCSWDKKTKVKQETVIKDNHTLSRFSIVNERLDLRVRTDWYDFPFKNGHTITDLLLAKVPALKENNVFLPLIEITSERENARVAMCSSYVLKEKTIIKNFVPMRVTLDWYKLYKERNSKFQLCTGEHVLTVSPGDVIEIIEK